MDGIFNKFLSVLREVTDEDKQLGTNPNENDDEKDEINEEELKKEINNGIEGLGNDEISNLITENEIYSEPETAQCNNSDSSPGSSFSYLQEEPICVLDKDAPSDEHQSETPLRLLLRHPSIYQGTISVAQISSRTN